MITVKEMELKNAARKDSLPFVLFNAYEVEDTTADEDIMHIYIHEMSIIYALSMGVQKPIPPKCIFGIPESSFGYTRYFRKITMSREQYFLDSLAGENTYQSYMEGQDLYAFTMDKYECRLFFEYPMKTAEQVVETKEALERIKDNEYYHESAMELRYRGYMS